MIKKLFNFAVVLVLASLAVPLAKADTFNFDFTGGGGLSEAAVVTTTDTLNSSGALTILSVVGEINGINLTGLSSFASADEFLYPSAPYVDFSGVSFAAANGVDYTVGSYDGVVYETDSVTDPSGVLVTNEPVTLTVSDPVPEPSSLVLIGLGLVALALMGKRFDKVIRGSYLVRA